MASLVTSSVVADIRGKVGSEVYARNGSGLYVRSLGSWVQPDTQRQLDCRAAIAALSAYWSSTLTEQQRADWQSYAHRHPRPNRWGEHIQTSGYLSFIATNAYRYRALTQISWPNAPNKPPLHPPKFTFTANVAADTITVALPPDTYDPPPAMLNLWLFAGEPKSKGRNYFNGPWRFVGANLNTPPWTSDPWTVASPWTIDANKRMWCYLVAQDWISGALSQPARAQHDPT